MLSVFRSARTARSSLPTASQFGDSLRAGRDWIEAWAAELRFHTTSFTDRVRELSVRMQLRGWRRGLVEFGSEALTLGAAGSVLMLALALPAFQATATDWRSEGDFAVTFLDRTGREIGRRGSFRRDSVPVDEMPAHLVEAVLATEDRRFFEHYGIDQFGVARAVAENLRANGVVQGGSTLTQQLAKNLFLSNERTMDRKVKEAFLALWLEANLTKKEILQLYLDRAYMGGPTFGVSAAAEFYFGKNVRNLSLAESAMLAGLFKAPARFAPHVNLPAARARANEVLTNLVQGGFMTESQVATARLHPADVVDRGEPEHPDYFLDWAFGEAKRIAGPLGLRVMVARTTIDLDYQRDAESALESSLRQFGKQYRVDEGAIVLLENTGAVRAIVGGRDYGRSQFNRATRAERQPGSSFKPYVYALAMEKGFSPRSTISDAPIRWGNWAPRNYSRSFNGTVTLTDALVRSLNSVPVRLAKEKLGLEPIRQLVARMGVETPVENQRSIVLGTSGMTVMDQATGYSVFANGGMAGTRFGITQLSRLDGTIVYDHARDAPGAHRVLSQEAVAKMNTMLVQVPRIGTAKRAALPGINSGGKTGTTQGYRDGWYVGFTGNFTAAVWMGNDDFTPTREMTGGTLPAILWNRMMTDVQRNVALKPIPGVEDFAPSPSAVAETDGEQAPVPVAPRILSDATAQVLLQLGRRLREDPAPNVEPAVMSAL